MIGPAVTGRRSSSSCPAMASRAGFLLLLLGSCLLSRLVDGRRLLASSSDGRGAPEFPGCFLGPADVEVASEGKCLEYSKTMMRFCVDFPIIVDSANAALIGKMLDLGKEQAYTMPNEEELREKYIKRAEFRRGRLTMLFNCDMISRKAKKAASFIESSS